MNETVHSGPRPTEAPSQLRIVEGPRQRRVNRPAVNITPRERAGRVIVGAGAVVVGVFLLTSAASVLAVVLEALLILAGLDLVVTGAIGHCPLYQRLGHVPKSLRRPT